MPIIGLTSGFAYETVPPVSPRALRLCRRVGCRAVEINCVGGKAEAERLDDIGLSDVRAFDHVSIHAPCRNTRFADDQATRDLLCRIEKACARLQVDLVVFHPDLIDDWNVFSEFDIPAAIENLDNRKKSYRGVSDLKNAFDKLDCRFVLDINHCFANDPTLKLASEMIEAFRDRLAEIHVSGYQGYHELLYRTKQTKILDAIYNLDAPMIIESACPDPERDARKELNYIKKYFRKKDRRERHWA
ncbi:MAG: hypothetical protein V1867_05155 [Candidatus Falkowbacteria bacterium]